MLSRLIPKKWTQDDNYLPTISILLPAHNEESVIRQCIHSLLQLDYPRELVEIIIGSDGSTDNTNNILAAFAKEHAHIRVLNFHERRGKMLVINDLAQEGIGELFFFTDSDIQLSGNSLKVHARHYADNSVGAVAGSYEIVADQPTGVFTSEEKLVSSEIKLRENESRIHSTIGMFGGNYSIRKRLWVPLPDAYVYDDVYVVLSLITRGFRIIFEPQSIAVDRHSRTLEDEFRRKTRSASFGFATLRYFPELVGFRKGLLSLMLWSHKILRWIGPWMFLFIGVTIIYNYCSSHDLIWQVFFCFELLLLIACAIGFISYKSGKSIPIVRHIFWFCCMQVPFILGTLRFITKSESQAWVQPTRAHVIP